MYYLKKLIPGKKLVFLLWVLLMAYPTLNFAQQRNLDAVLAKIIKSPDVNQGLRTQPTSQQPFLIKIKPGVKKESLITNGITVLRTIDQHYLIVKPTKSALSQTLYEEKWTVNHLWKLSDELLLHGDQTTRQTFTISVSDPSVPGILSAIPQLSILSSKNNILTVTTTLETIINKVIAVNGVLYVGKEATNPRVESPVKDMNLNPNTVNRIHHFFPALTGEGITISIQEQPYNTEDIDLKGRHIPSSISAGEASTHATDMATIAAGAGNSFITGKGVAWGASVTSSDFEDLLPDADEDYATLNSWVQNHSYGTEIENFYGTRAEAFDKSANRNPTLLHVFSSGNEGAATSATGPYQGIEGLANLTGNFKMSKNILTVGSVDAVGQPVAFSSRGPAYDGRIKPEVVAYSTAGTSNSAALVSGIAALLQQAYQQQQGNLPPAALLKSLLINSAQDAGPVGIDYITGFGNVDAYRTLQNLTAKRYFSGSISQGQTKSFPLQVPATARKLKVTLVWNDPAALPNAGFALVNDLDMQLTTEGNTWLPWKLDPSADFAKLTKAATRGADHLNTIEQIMLDKPVAGTYTITVKGFDLAAGSQSFYISYQWDTTNQFEWLFPTGSDNMPFDGESDTYFSWKSTLADTLGKLEYTLDQGITWISINDHVNLKNGTYMWKTPELTTRAQARMVVGNEVFPTLSFTISWPLPITVGFNCGDSLLVQWPFAENVKEYELSVFEGNSLKTIVVTSDTAIVLKKTQLTSPLFAIQSLLKEGGHGLRAHTFDYASLSSSCFLVSFGVETVRENGIDLLAELGTIYGIDRILVERQKNGIFETIHTIQPESKQVRIQDTHPLQGLNTYRIRILFPTGKEIISETVRSYFVADPPVMVFPNPVSNAEKLQVFSKEFASQEVVFRLFDLNGKIKLTTHLLSSRETIPLNGLLPGLYVYSIQTDEGIFNGKLLVR
ncbi:S8 family serine peptidase [Rhodocytophaga rosea]|uniref:S8 family serine peptidase n=1 Tax=Rhodocytophaga rosea TaxID=2704465 RepID=A0A6C0GC94_9BACT|nr:S8 family peptidase [Rhodocytophaga rosea]QHT65517.1 S8 family serine peptidase [Rhodocytophaga rosea]